MEAKKEPDLEISKVFNKSQSTSNKEGIFTIMLKCLCCMHIKYICLSKFIIYRVGT